MIANHLTRYYEANGKNPTYEIVRSIVIDGHEVAWMKYDGTIENDIMGEGHEGEPYFGHQLYCECYFTENVGWMIVENDKVCGIYGHEKCIYRSMAMHMRCLELREEYLKRFDMEGSEFFLLDHVPEIIFDLIEKAKAGEFIGEDGGGAACYGGFFYVQTIGEIIGREISAGENISLNDQFAIWKIVRKLIDKKKIDLLGAIVQPYREPSPPTWAESFRVEDEGWIGIASLPTHSKMEQKWKLEVMRPDGTSVGPAYKLPLLHDSMFGPDVDDCMSAEEQLKSLIDIAKGEF